ncbi:hypothetical protein ABZ499_13305 [Streptomyces sp. NPDC019990]|uniref:hypothetical protein n=1 Tax=Streptomyces sp. NPDC019990 TaxID=3154693 RepID=UPI0033F7C325
MTAPGAATGPATRPGGPLRAVARTPRPALARAARTPAAVTAAPVWLHGLGDEARDDVLLARRLP